MITPKEVSTSPISLTIECRPLTQPQDYQAAYALMCQLYPDLDATQYQNFIQQTVPHTNRLFGLFLNEEMITAVSCHQLQLIGGENVLWIIHMVTDKDHRSHGYGQILVEYLATYARENGFQQLRVHSFSYRERAHNFYRTHAGMPEIATVFGKRLDD